MAEMKLDKQNRPIHPLGFRIWRRRNGWPTFMQRVREAYWCLTCKWTLHMAWQRGYDQHAQDESLRRSRGGR